METSPHIDFRHMQRSEMLEHQVRRLVDRLKSAHQHITGCHVVIEAPFDQGEPGQRDERDRTGAYLINVEVTIPGGVVNSSTTPGKYDRRVDAYVVLRDTFDAASRQLAEFAAAH